MRRSGGLVISGCFQVHPTALTAGWIQTGPPIKTFGGDGFKSVLVSRAIFKRSHHGHEALVVCACAPSENPATGALNPSTVDGAADKLLQSNSRARAASEIATTAGCLSLRSNEIAKNCSRTALAVPIILTLYWRRTSALITDGAKNNPSPRCPNTCSRALSSHSATITGRIFSVSNHWSRERRAAVFDVGSKKGAPSRH